jgi:hypothetical protein
LQRHAGLPVQKRSQYPYTKNHFGHAECRLAKGRPASTQTWRCRFFRTQGGTRSNHVGLYIGDNRFIHAPRTGKTIRINSMDNSYWKKNYTTARRFYGRTQGFNRSQKRTY